MNGSPSSVLSVGFGSWGSTGLVLTLGFGISEVTPAPDPPFTDFEFTTVLTSDTTFQA